MACFKALGRRSMAEIAMDEMPVGMDQLNAS
jgi:hypothetical protein